MATPSVQTPSAPHSAPDSASDPSQGATLGALLRRLVESLDGDVQSAYQAAGLGFRPRYTPIVRALLSDGPVTIKALAARTRLTHSAASQTVAQMTRDGLLSAASGADARERIISLTPAARALLPQLQRQWDAAAAAARSLDDDIGVSLQDVVSKALEALEQRPFRARLDGAEGGGPPPPA